MLIFITEGRAKGGREMEFNLFFLIVEAQLESSLSLDFSKYSYQFLKKKNLPEINFHYQIITGLITTLSAFSLFTLLLRYP